MDFPLFKTFKIDELTTNFLNKKYEDYSKSFDLKSADGSIYVSKTGHYTQNLVDWDDKEYQKFARNELTKIISNNLKINNDQFSIHFSHFFDYNKGGFVAIHTHEDAEDFVLIFYLNDIKVGGETLFFLNRKKEFKERTFVKIKPTKSLVTCFSSMVPHSAEWTSEPKRIYVVGVRINLINMR